MKSTNVIKLIKRGAAISLCVQTLWLASCGTISSTLTSDSYTRGELRAHKTYCEKLPRVYAGLAYDFCLFHAEPVSYHPAVYAYSLNFIPYIVVEAALSGVLDTIVLPYTVIQQIDRGSLEL